jgi:formamidopyrimidine-DNA glycosylase
MSGGADPPPGRIRPTELLAGATVADIRRHGKQLAIIAADGRALSVHLGMTGQLIYKPGRAPKAATPAGGRTDHVHAAWRLEEGGHLLFRDPRRFGGLWSFPSVEALIAARWSPLGPDALTISTDRLAPRLAATARPIKAALLDQVVLAGVGNIYADEALFHARLHPAMPAKALEPAQVDRLARAIRDILGRAVQAGGSTLRDYVDANGQPGRHQFSHSVYGRAGLACRVCGSILVGSTLAQRTTVHCPQCQGPSAP